MNIAMISFTRKGMELSFRIKEYLEGIHEVEVLTKFKAVGNPLEVEEKSAFLGKRDIRQMIYVEESLSDWTKKKWKQTDALLFIGACGIAVRAIAPFVEDKFKDPAVLVMDEMGQFIIPILSGHVGGANELAQEIARKSKAIPVITTATDLHQLFAVDVFAKKNNLGIANREGIAKVSGALLEGEAVSVLLSPFEGERATLQLCPKTYVVGIGCKRGKEEAEIEELVMEAIKEAGIRIEAVAVFASIDKKADEPGILALAEKYRIPFQIYSAEELEAVEGDFSSSEFVKSQVGVDNVCERAALLAAGRLGKSSVVVHEKMAKNGVTVAIAKFIC